VGGLSERRGGLRKGSLRRRERIKEGVPPQRGGRISPFLLLPSGARKEFFFFSPPQGGRIKERVLPQRKRRIFLLFLPQKEEGGKFFFSFLPLFEGED